MWSLSRDEYMKAGGGQACRFPFISKFGSQRPGEHSSRSSRRAWDRRVPAMPSVDDKRNAVLHELPSQTRESDCHAPRCLSDVDTTHRLPERTKRLCLPLLLATVSRHTCVRPRDFQGRQDGGAAMHCIRETLRSFETVSSARLANQHPYYAPKQQPLVLVPSG